MYLIVISRNGNARYELSRSRNAVAHCERTGATQVQVYDSCGWLKSMAEKHDGKIVRPQMYLDGEPKAFYKRKFQELMVAFRKGGSKPPVTVS